MSYQISSDPHPLPLDERRRVAIEKLKYEIDLATRQKQILEAEFRAKIKSDDPIEIIANAVVVLPFCKKRMTDFQREIERCQELLRTLEAEEGER